MHPTGAVAPLLVRAIRAHGHRPAAPGSGAPTWSAVADEARALAVGLTEVGVEPGRVVEVDPTGLAPHDVVARELAVLSAGAVLALPGVAGAAPDATLRRGTLAVAGRADVGAPVDEVRRRGRAADAEAPARHDEALAALAPGVPAVVLPGRTATAGEVAWAVRAVDRWLEPAAGDPPPASVLVAEAAPPALAVTVALLGRWWPASVGATLLGPGDDEAEVVVGGPVHWGEVAAGVRTAARRSRRSTRLLRRGRLVAAGEEVAPPARARLALDRQRAGRRLRHGAGVGALRIGVAWEPLAPVDGRDLAAAVVPVVAAWCAPEAVAPLASGPVGGPDPSSPWARPLPGRDLAVDGAAARATGGDLPEGAADIAGPAPAVDERGRLRLERR